ncbi:MAG: hypothetical protein Kow00108_00120 [Calditrichia bacterium]
MKTTNRHFRYLASVYDALIPSPSIEDYNWILERYSNPLVLDAGGGTGRFTHIFKPTSGLIMVLDIEKRMVEKAKDKHLIPIQGAVENMPIQTESIDVVFIIDAFHHFTDHLYTLSECYRILKPGGSLIIEEPDISTFPVKIVAFLEKIVFMRSHFYSPTEIHRMMEQSQFMVSKEYPSSFYSRIIGVKE